MANQDVIPAPADVIVDLRRKLGWALKHLVELRDVVAQFKAQPKRPIERRHEPLNGRFVVRLHSWGEAPGDLPLLLSDFVYATRSTLDHLAWQLSHLTLPIPPTDVMFPVHAAADLTSERRFERRTQGIPPAAVEEIRALQPHRLGDRFREHPLWQLNELSNIDKHRMFAIHANSANVYVHPPPRHRQSFVDYIELSWPYVDRDSVVVEPYTWELLFGHPVDVPGNHLSLGQQDLDRMVAFVAQRVLPRFERFFAPGVVSSK